MTRTEFAATNRTFRSTCRLVGCQPTRHQAGLWRRQRGVVWRRWVRVLQEWGGLEARKRRDTGMTAVDVPVEYLVA